MWHGFRPQVADTSPSSYSLIHQIFVLSMIQTLLDMPFHLQWTFWHCFANRMVVTFMTNLGPPVIRSCPSSADLLIMIGDDQRQTVVPS
jgi:hypothetical protein